MTFFYDDLFWRLPALIHSLSDLQVWLGIAAIALIAGIAAAIITAAVTKRKIIGKIDFMSDALDSGESAFRYSESDRSNRRLNRSLNRLRSIFEKDKNDIRERERYFGIMLDHVQSGVIVLDGEKVDYSNEIARGLLGMSDIVSLRQIERISPELAQTFRTADVAEKRAAYPSERGKAVFSVSACGAKLHSAEVKIITFNDITREIENNEAESWSRLIRVLTHEIMNTVTPISTLSSALSTGLENYSEEEIRSALGTIAASSGSLLNFVQSYRSLTHIATPIRKAFYFREVAEDAINICRTNWPETNIGYKELADDIILYADQGQVSQVVNNLVKNAVQAGAKNIRITAGIDKRDRTTVDISNDGAPISEESRDQIFVPFFTTKGSAGTGVGLSLSRQMIRQNGGSLKLSTSTPTQTTFTICFE